MNMADRVRIPALPPNLAGMVILLAINSICLAHDHSDDLVIDAPFATITATLSVPGHVDPAEVPCVVIAGGTLSQGRDGHLFRAGSPKRDALRRLAEALGAGGYASLRYDRVGFGASKPKAEWRGRYADEARALATVVEFLRTEKKFKKVVVAGESAGAYLACLAAKDGAHADAYVFLGGHCGPGEEIYAYNFGRLVEQVEKYQENLIWAAKLRRELALGRHYKAMFAAAEKGERSFELTDGDFRMTVDLTRRREELDLPPDRMFRFITTPALALSGEFDLNVAPDHAARAVRIMKDAGNEHVKAVTIARADHSFQLVAGSEFERVRERFTCESFKRPYQPDVYREVILWLRATLPTPLPAELGRLEEIASDGLGAIATAVRGAQREVAPATEYEPERVHLAPGITIVEDITDKEKTAGVETLEGRIGPLLLGEGCQAHFIDMPGGMYVEEHPHSSESLIYTVRGRWVLCSAGKRRVMNPGSLFRFAARTPTGYEVPFAEDAYLLIFKGDRLSKSEKEFIDYLRGMKERLRREQKEGIPYLLRDLPQDHEARRFAREINPRLEASPPGSR